MRSLFWICMGPILNIVRWSSSVFNNQSYLIHMWKYVYWDSGTHTQTYGSMSLNNNIITWLHSVDLVLITCYTILLWLIYACITWAYNTLPGTHMFVYARHLALFFALVVLLFNNLGPTYPDPRVWNEVDPSVEDKAFLMEQADHQ